MNLSVFTIPTLIITIFFLYFFWKKSKRICCPGVVFNGLWAGVILLNFINYNRFYQISEYTYFVILTGLFCFNIGFLIVKTKRNYNFNESKINSFVLQRRKNIILFEVLQIFILITLIPLTVKSITYHTIYGNAAFRTVYANGVETGYMTTFQRMFYIHYGIFPLNIALLCIGVVLLSRNLIQLRHIMISVLNLALIVYDSGNRGDILIAMIFLVFSVDLSQNMKNQLSVFFQSKRIKQYTRILMFAGGVGLIAASILRANWGQDNVFAEILKLLTTNFSGGLNLLNKALESPNEWGIGSYYGQASFYGFLSLFFFALRIVSLGGINIQLESPTSYASEFFSVSPTIKMNAYTTAFYTFAEDFGFIGVVALTIFFGAVAMCIYKRCLKNPTIRNTCYLILTLYVLFYTSVTWQLTATHVAILFVHVWWICKLLERN